MNISIVIPTLNEAENIQDCLKSLQAQARRPEEVIVVDSGSRDRTAAIARAHGARVIELPKTEGRFDDVGLARQRGSEEAVGELIVSTDADCTADADWLAKIEERFEENPGLVLLGGPSYPLDRSIINDWMTSIMNFHRSYWAGWRVPIFSGQNTSFRKEAFTVSDGYKGVAAHGPVEEWIVSMRLARVGEWMWDDDVYVYIKIPLRRQLEATILPLSVAPLGAWAGAVALQGMI